MSRESPVRCGTLEEKKRKIGKKNIMSVWKIMFLLSLDRLVVVVAQLDGPGWVSVSSPCSTSM